MDADGWLIALSLSIGWLVLVCLRAIATARSLARALTLSIDRPTRLAPTQPHPHFARRQIRPHIQTCDAFPSHPRRRPLSPRAQWYPEVAHFCESTPLLLIATKTDLRQDARAIELLAAQGRQPITTAEGQAVAKRIGAQRYLEVCALRDRGVKEVFAEAVEEALGGGRRGGRVEGSTRRRRGTKCVVL